MLKNMEKHSRLIVSWEITKTKAGKVFWITLYFMQQSQPPQLQADLPPQPLHGGVHEMDQVERKEDETRTENERMTKQKLKLKIERKYLLICVFEPYYYYYILFMWKDEVQQAQNYCNWLPERGYEKCLMFVHKLKSQLQC